MDNNLFRTVLLHQSFDHDDAVHGAAFSRLVTEHGGAGAMRELIRRTGNSITKVCETAGYSKNLLYAARSPAPHAIVDILDLLGYELVIRRKDDAVICSGDSR